MSNQNSGISCDAFNDDGCGGIPYGFGYHTPDDLATRFDVVYLLILVLGFPCTYLQTKPVIDCLYGMWFCLGARNRRPPIELLGMSGRENPEGGTMR